MSDYYCPNCGSDLEEQFGFDSSDGYWTCAECGKLLTNPKDSNDNGRYNDVGWFCDECGAFLNKQSGFSDWYDTWTCTECGYINNISEDEIYKSEEGYQKYKDLENSVENVVQSILGGIQDLFNSSEDYYDDDNEEEDDDDDDIESKYDDRVSKFENKKVDLNTEDGLQRQQEIKYPQVDNDYRQTEVGQARNNKRKVVFKRIWSAIIHKKMIDVNVSSAECIGQNYLKVISTFEKSGFNNIQTNMIEDLEYDEKNKENIVSDISVDGKHSFTRTSRAKYDTDIIITFHKLRRVVLPMSLKEAKKRNGRHVIRMFEDAGFVNVIGNEIRDLTFGWLKKDGKIDSITLDGERKFKSDKIYRIDVPIVVTFHTFKKK